MNDDLIRRQAVLDIVNNPLNIRLDEIIKKLPSVNPQEPILNKIRAEIAEYKDDKIIHAESNEMIDIVLEIIDKYRKGGE